MYSHLILFVKNVINFSFFSFLKMFYSFDLYSKLALMLWSEKII